MHPKFIRGGIMLTKNTEIVIEKTDPFKYDCLNRKQSIVDLTNLVQSTNQPFVISIEAPWGWGKSTFVRLWKTYLEQEKHPCLYFNAWSNDFAEDPLIAFISEMSDLLTEVQDSGNNKAIKAAIRKTQKIGGSILRKSLPVVLRIATQGLIDTQTLETLKDAKDEFGSTVEELTKDRINIYEQNKKGIIKFRESLGELAKLIAKDENKKVPLIFFVDELDRCRPDYALELLERIKHLFSVEGVIFVLSLDRKQLSSSVKAVYGNEIDTDGYLRRFIDLSYRLPTPSSEQFSNMLFGKFNLNEVFLKRKEDKRFIYDQSEFENLTQDFKKLSMKFELSLRVQEQCMTEINIILRTTGPNYILHTPLLVFLVVIKSYKPQLYQILHEKNPNLEDLVSTIKNLLIGDGYSERYYEALITASVISNYNNEEKPCAMLQKLQEVVKEPRVNSESNLEQERAGMILQLINQKVSFHNSSKALSQVMKRIDNIGNYLG